MLILNSFNGMSDTTAPLKIKIFAFWFVEIPLSWFLDVVIDMNEQGVLVAIVIAEFLGW
jgi:Na+-driven multidrug efflux pump